MRKFLPFLVLAVLFIACDPKNLNGTDDPLLEENVITFASSVDVKPIFYETGGDATVSFSTTKDWSASVVNTRADSWCTVSPTSGTAGSVILNINVKENTSPNERSASITIKSGDDKETIVVTQKQKDALTLTASTMEVEAKGGEVSIEVKSNISYSYEVENDGKNWIKFVKTKALHTSNMIFSIAENDSLGRREADIYVVGGELRDTITVFQAGAAPSIVISEDTCMVATTGGAFDVNVASNVSATMEAIFPEGVEPWFKEDATKAMSTNKYTFIAEKNPAYDNREALIVFTNTENEVSDTIKVIQSQISDIVIGEKVRSLDYKEQALEMELLTNVMVEIELLFADGDSSWIEPTKTKGLENEVFTFNISENKGDVQRVANIVFKNDEHCLNDTVKVIQYPKCLIIGDRNVIIESKGDELEVKLLQPSSMKIVYTDEQEKDWLSCSPEREVADIFKLEIKENKEYDSREAMVIFSNEASRMYDTLRVYQNQQNAIILGSNKQTIDYKEQAFDVEIRSNVDASVEILFLDGVESWFEKSETKGLIRTVFTFQATENKGEKERSGKIIFKNENTNLSDTVVVVQYPKGLIKGEKEVAVASSGGEFDVELIQEASMDITFPDEVDDGKEWVLCDKKKSSKFHFTVLKSEIYDARKAKIVFSSGKMSDTLEITQEQVDTILVKNAVYEVSHEEQIIEVDLSHNVEIADVVIDEESSSWIQQVETKGLENKILSFMVAENKDKVRKGKIKVIGKNSKEIDITIKQKSPYTIRLSRNSYEYQRDDFLSGFSLTREIVVESQVPIKYKHKEYVITCPFSEDYGEDADLVRVESLISNYEDEHKFEVYIRFGDEITPETYKECVYFYNEEYGLIDSLVVICNGNRNYGVITRDDDLNESGSQAIFPNNEDTLELIVASSADYLISYNEQVDWFSEGEHKFGTEYREDMGGVKYDTLVFIPKDNVGYTRDAKITYMNEYGYERTLCTLIQVGSDDVFEVNVNGAGTLESLIDIEEFKRYTHIKLTGTASSVDFKVFTSAGDWLLEKLDLSELYIEDGMINDFGLYVGSQLTTNTKYTNFSKLREVYFPPSLKSIGPLAFYGCSNLEIIDFGDNSQLEEIKGHHRGAYLGGGRPHGPFAYSKISSIKLPASFKALWGGAFAGCENLKSVDLEHCKDIKELKGLSLIQVREYGNSPLVTVAAWGLFAGIPNITSFEVPESVERIGDWAFYGSPIEEITINSTVKSFSANAFEGANFTKINSDKYSPDGISIIVDGRLMYVAKNVEEYVMPSCVTSISAGAFDGNDFKKIVFSDGVKSIPEKLLDDCKSLEEVVLPTELSSIPDKCFFNKLALESITMPQKLESIGQYAFAGTQLSGSLNLNEGLLSVGEGAFSHTNVTDVVFPASCTIIGGDMFKNCKELKSVRILGDIDWSQSDMTSFYEYCSKLEEFAIPEGIPKIYSSMFAECPIETIVVPSTVVDIGEYAFCRCSNLKSVKLNRNVTRIGSNAFKECVSLVEIEIQSSVTAIYEYAFSGCTSLKEVNIPGSVKSLGKDLFHNCTALEKVILSEGIESVDDLFNNSSCPLLKTIIYPSTITSVSVHCLYNSHMTEIYMKPPTPPSGLHTYSTNYDPYFMPKIYVPSASVDAYKAHRYWKQFSDNIVGYTF